MRPPAQLLLTKVLLNKVTEANNLSQGWRGQLHPGEELGQNPLWCMEELLQLVRVFMLRTSINTLVLPARFTLRHLHTSMKDKPPVDTRCSRREETWTKPDDNSLHFTSNTPVLQMSIEFGWNYVKIQYFINDKLGVLKVCHIVYFKILTLRL